MHETLIADKIITKAKEQGDVEEITLELGELGHVPPEELVGCLKQLVDWKINWTEKKSTAKCVCGFEGHPKVLDRGHDFYIIECPDCGGVPDVIDGKDAKLLSVRVK